MPPVIVTIASVLGLWTVVLATAIVFTSERFHRWRRRRRVRRTTRAVWRRCPQAAPAWFRDTRRRAVPPRWGRRPCPHRSRRVPPTGSEVP